MISSDQARTSLSESARRKAVEVAEAEILERRIVTIPAKDWKAFERWARRPGQKIAGLTALASTKPSWEE